MTKTTNNDVIQKKTEDFRNYKDSYNQDRVANFYAINHKNQTLDFVEKTEGKIPQIRRKTNDLLGCVPFT